MPFPPWLIWFVIGCAAMVGFALSPETPVGSAGYAVVAGGAVAAVLLGMRQHRPRDPGPWYAIGGGLALLGLGDLVQEAVAPHALDPGFAWSDVPYLAAYPLLLWAVARMLRGEAAGRDDTDPIDAAIVATAGGALAWVFIVSPAAPALALPAGARLLAMAYPLADLVLLAMTALLLARGGWAAPSGRALGVAAAALLVGDGVFGWLRLHGGDPNAITPNLLWLGSWVAFGIAALLPSMTALTEVAAARPGGRFTSWRIVLLGAGALAVPLLFAARAAGLVVFDDLPVAVAFALASVLVVARIGILSGRLEDAADRYRTLVEQIPVVVYIHPIEVTDRLEYVSPRIRQLLGHPAEAVAGVPNFIDERIHPDDFAAVQAAADAVEASEGPFLSEYRLLAADGSWRWVRDEAILVRDGAGRPLHWQGVLSDITDLKAAEVAQRQSEDLFRTAFSDAPIGLALVGLDGRFLRVNRALCGIVGYGEEELLARTFHEITHPEDLAADVALLDRLVAGEIPHYQMEKRYFNASGDVVWVQLSVSLVRDGAGQPLRFVSQIQDITAQKQAAADLAAERDLLATLMEQIPDAVFVKDTDLRFVRLNAATGRLLGVADARDALGTSDADHFPAAHAAELAAAERAVLAGTAMINRLEATAFGDGDGWIRSSKVPLRDPAGRVIGLIGVNRDVTDEHRALEHLRAAEERFRNLVEHLPLAVYVDPADQLGTPSYVSPQIGSLLGYAPDEWLGNPDLWIACIHPEDRAGVLAELARSRGQGVPFHMEYRALSRDGRVVWLRDHALPVLDDAGVRKYWQGVLVDVTDRRLADEAVRRHAERLAAVIAAQLEVAAADPDPQEVMEIVARRAMALVAGDGAAVALVDGDDLVTRAAGGTAAVYAGRRRPLGRSLASLCVSTSRAYVSHDLEADPRVDVAAARQSGSRSTIVVPLNHRGRVVGVLQTMANRPHAFDDGDVQVLQLVAGLIGGALANADAFAAMSEARNAAEEASRLKSQFLSTMSHELRTPMNAIIGYAHLLLEGMAGELTEPQAADVRQIAAGADRLLALIDDVLDLSRIEAGRMDLEPEPVAVAEVVESVVASVRPQAAAKGLAVRVDLPAALPPAFADPVRLRQILLNVVGNAVKFTPAGQVAISARAAEGGIEVAVADTGIGIAPDALPHVFDEFRQADSSTTRRFGGSGLGLAIVRRLLDLQGGAIRVASTPGVGSTFTIRLPAPPGNDGASPVSPGSAGQGAGAAARRG